MCIEIMRSSRIMQDKNDCPVYCRATAEKMSLSRSERLFTYKHNIKGIISPNYVLHRICIQNTF